ncbi:nucleotidyl transferase AbiEii/AbiGii toxin family protein [Candidatus Dojkabacteria bacterium]|nr:nucleotidyl transferase AbiEii/AbiGii toxin family protein [Candidatus Dojkabacteria bacterium]
MNTIHREVLNKKQLELWPLLPQFKDFYLAGGTSLALQIGHRKSIDFDLFHNAPINTEEILKLLDKNRISNVIVDTQDEFTLIYNQMKLTFLNYPFNVKTNVKLENIESIDPLTIAAMKAYALGRRAKWKDYVDLYFVSRKYSLDHIIDRAKNIFDNLFSEKLFRTQLCYFDDVDYTEKVEYTEGHEVTDKKIKEHLKKVSTDL